MDIDISYAYHEEDLRALPIEELIAFALRFEGRAEETEVSVSFVDDNAIAELNERYRGKAGPTDVLSFECDGVDDGFDGASAEAPFALGDIVIAPDVAERQTQEFGTSFEEEISLLLVHGTLHLCGYDHVEDAEASVMEAREDAILAAWRELRSQRML